MDSGNSGGSLQSSSGGDDEFDSRGGGGVDSSPLSALLRPSPSAAFSLHGSLYGFQELASAGTSQQPQQQLPGTWSTGQFAAGAPSSSSPPVAQGDGSMGAGANQQADPSAAAQGAPPPRGSRKRTRASRRAPTTVLTTDTSNFRAMVQEFTGIPSPPFVAGGVAPASSLRTRFDHLFPSPSTLRSAAGAAADPASSLPPYLLRPFAQKLQTAPSPFPPFTSSSSLTPSSSNIGVANANATTTCTAAATTATSVNSTAARAGGSDTFQLTAPSALLRMQDTNSYLSFPNILGSQSQPSPQHMFGGFTQGPRLHDTSPSPSFSEFLSSGGGISLTDGGLISSDNLHLHPRNDAHHGGDELSGVVASGSGGGAYGSCKVNYSPHAGASSSPATASADKPPDTAAARSARGEGLDPWICTSE
ncbi:hypothetical protein GUJ93_ZPchr0002g26211 [Zizania palustris]|uniref:VQ domain-containing protein n=1 Tax=Zizania palustris TaxID=103762 RepID=A0A8J5V3B7_ZIZPA|nr:hypothetical protein GUJ93_ZPchr0002g26211 [Zizania palustris]